MPRQLYETADGKWIEDGEMCYWHSNAPGKGEVEKESNLEHGCFTVEYRYGELYEIALGYTNGGYTTRYSEFDVKKDVYKDNPYEVKEGTDEQM